MATSVRTPRMVAASAIATLIAAGGFLVWQLARARIESGEMLGGTRRAKPQVQGGLGLQSATRLEGKLDALLSDRGIIPRLEEKMDLLLSGRTAGSLQEPQSANSAMDPSDTTCLFLLATPGSGSSTMVELLSQCATAHSSSCAISGENWGALQHLARFQSSIARTDRISKESKGNSHDEAAWRKYYNTTDVEQGTKNLVATMLNPGASLCWGFKEIRYGRASNEMTFSDDIEFLSSLCKKPKFVLHSRKDPKKEFNSTVLKGREPEQQFSVKQHSCFDSRAGLPNSSACAAEKGAPDVFRFYLEDYLEENDNFRALWEYLECANELPKGGLIMKVSKNESF